MAYIYQNTARLSNMCTFDQICCTAMLVSILRAIAQISCLQTYTEL